MDLRTMYVEGPCSFATWLVAMLLLSLAVAWLATVVGGAWTHLRMRRHSRLFRTAADPLLKSGQWAEVVALAQSHAARTSPVARTVAVGLEAWLSHEERGTDPLLAWQVAQASMRQETDEQAVAARRGLRTLVVGGGTATLVGLLGGIFGLYDAAWAASITGPDALVSPGILEALLMPALGLLISVLALWAGAWLARSAEKMHLEIGRAVTSVLDQLASSSATAGRG
jgi:biopolymer transport protein ExbB/TolQ